MRAAVDGNKTKIRQLKAKHGINVAFPGLGLTALHLAAIHSANAAKLLIEGNSARTHNLREAVSSVRQARACVTNACVPHGTHPIHSLSLMHAEGASVTSVNDDYQTPLSLACEYSGPGRPTKDAAVLEIVKLLVAAGADVRHTDTQGGYTVLHCACMRCLPSVVEYLVQPQEQGGCGGQALMQQPSKEVRACLYCHLVCCTQGALHAPAVTKTDAAT